MIDCDLSFEKSDVIATVSGEIMSVKNPKSGRITADSIGEIIMENTDSSCEINVLSKSNCAWNDVRELFRLAGDRAK